jgi:predicted hydrocarbon binding protein
MKEEMTLKEFMEETFKTNMFQAMNTARDLIELESIERRINVLWGVELDIKIKPVEKKEGRFYGKSVLEAIEKDFPKK